MIYAPKKIQTCEAGNEGKATMVSHDHPKNLSPSVATTQDTSQGFLHFRSCWVLLCLGRSEPAVQLGSTGFQTPLIHGRFYQCLKLAAIRGYNGAHNCPQNNLLDVFWRVRFNIIQSTDEFWNGFSKRTEKKPGWTWQRCNDRRIPEGLKLLVLLLLPWPLWVKAPVVDDFPGWISWAKSRRSHVWIVNWSTWPWLWPCHHHMFTGDI